MPSQPISILIKQMDCLPLITGRIWRDMGRCNLGVWRAGFDKGVGDEPLWGFVGVKGKFLDSAGATVDVIDSATVAGPAVIEGAPPDGGHSRVRGDEDTVAGGGGEEAHLELSRGCGAVGVVEGAVRGGVVEGYLEISC